MTAGSEELALHRAVKVAREAHRKATIRFHRMRIDIRLAKAEMLSAHADLLAAEAALREAQR